MALQIKANRREITGKASRKLRHQGLLPAVIYGQRAGGASIQLDMRDFERVYARTGRTQLIDLVVEGGRPHKVLVREVQVSPRSNTLLHVDFHQVSLRERLQVDVPIVVTGVAEPVRAGEADVLQVAHTLKVDCLPTRIPEAVEVDVSVLTQVDAAVRVADLHLPEGVTAVADPEDLVVKLAAARVTPEAAEAEARAEEPAEPASAEEG